MLTQIREKATGWLAWVIVILITIPFALWGIQSYFEDTTEAAVATVNGSEIPFYAYQTELAKRRQTLLRQAEGSIDPALLDTPRIRKEVLDSMISSRLMGQYVNDRNYRLSDEDLKQRIEGNSAFFSDDTFDPDIYRAQLRANGFNVQSYELAERQYAAIQQLAVGIKNSAFVTEQELNNLLTLQSQQRKADYVILPADHYLKEAKVEDSEVDQYYEDNVSEYEEPARVKIEYIELNVDELAKAIESSETEIRETYEQTIERYTQAESRTVSHILFSVDESASDAERDEVLTQAEAVLAKAKAGADFAKLAKKHSEDPGSKDKGGDLGVIAKGQMVAPFEEAVFDMEADEIRGPIKTQFGYHVIKLTELKAERQKPFEEVRDEVVEATQRAQAENRYIELSETFENLVFEDADSLNTAATELGLEIKQTDWFGKRLEPSDEESEGETSEEKLIDEVQVRYAAFSEDVVNDGLNSPVIELGFDRMVALRKTDYEASRTKSLDDVRDEIVEHLKLEKSGTQARDRGNTLVASLNAAEITWKKLLKTEKLSAEKWEGTREDVPEDLLELGDSLFALASPDADTTVYSGTPLISGGYAIYALKQVIPGDSKTADESQRTEMSDQLLARESDGVFQQLLRTVQLDSEIIVNQSQTQPQTPEEAQ